MGAIKDIGKDCSSDGKENSKDSGHDILIDQMLIKQFQYSNCAVQAC
jgi:hypothetical protein